MNFKFSHRSYDSNMEPESNQNDDKSPAQTKSQNSINDGSKKIAGSNWKPSNINEPMTFYAILIQMVCRPYPVKRYEECWDHTDGWFTNCKHMTKT